MTVFNDRPNRRRQRTSVKLKLTQAFKQAPWRKQMQLTGMILLGLVVVVVVAGVYLSISGKAASAGLDAYRLNLERQTLERKIADRKAQIAQLTASSAMELRAKNLGFKRIDPEDAVYIPIPGYTGRQVVVLAAPPGIDESARSFVLPAYRQSVWDWLFQGINRLSESVAGGSL
jgi:cell division protein FtsL